MADLEVDVIITGTGITASVITGCLAYSGCKVLQIDRHHCYGQNNRTLSIKQLLESSDAHCLNSPYYLKQQYEAVFNQCTTQDVTGHTTVSGSSESNVVPTECITLDTSNHVNFKEQNRLMELMDIMYSNKDPTPQILYEISPFYKEGTRAIEVLDNLCANSSKHALDLWPKLVYSSSAAVDLLVNSGGHSYIHFTDANGPVLYGQDNANNERIQLQEVPHSRNAICRSQMLEPLEKRTLMQMVTDIMAGYCLPQFSSLSLKGTETTSSGTGNIAENLEEPDKNWLEFLRTRGCTPNIINVLCYGICMGGSDVGTWTKKEGVQRLVKYAQSINLYRESNSPFIYPMYGTGDIVQAFSRVSAVLGTVFMLRTWITSIGEPQENGLRNVTLSNGMTVRTKLLLLDGSQIGDTLYNKQVQYQQNRDMMDTLAEKPASTQPRRVHVLGLITEKPILPSLTLAVTTEPSSNPDETKDPVYIIQSGAEAGATPENTNVIYLMTVDNTEKAEFNDLANCTHPTIQRMLRICNKLCPDKGVLERALLSIYTAHEVGTEVNSDLVNMEAHRGWLSQDGCYMKKQGLGVAFIPKVKATPVVPLVEEIPLAISVVNTLLARNEAYKTAYDDKDLGKYIHVTRPEDTEDNNMDITAEKLQSIIEKYG
ncbi:GDP dissociation inhibitor family protein [Babesia bovis T2Bo]|uniref:Rab GDP dissociation inhibitor n=1 Tax=Babesia bovis TaxID=5865 RepID=A7AMQ4_BABBO|nr:GDP dissociation inhibitor family protein [Babesia bovis T2Bo]EDO07838.1 GDP dissociation inhibitor family protein [Babesia bovis T2Bo]|eukprot:XP_001611406.1 hypothetical protein [Babesia bovis T2Bo]